MHVIHTTTAKQIDAMEAQLSEWGESLDTLDNPEAESDPKVKSDRKVESDPNKDAKTRYHKQLLALAARVGDARARLKESIAARASRGTCHSWRASMA